MFTEIHHSTSNTDRMKATIMIIYVESEEYKLRQSDIEYIISAITKLLAFLFAGKKICSRLSGLGPRLLILCSGEFKGD